MKYMRSRSVFPAILTVGMLLATPAFAAAGNTSLQASRKTISLDGTWQIAEGRMDVVPTKFERQVPVPGLVDMATPGFVDPGPRVADRQQFHQKDPRRDAFWYRRTFQVAGALPVVARLKIGKAMFGTRVYLNGKLLGDHVPSFTPGYFDARAALKTGTNTLVVRVGADRDAVIGRAESGMDSEKVHNMPGIFDSVELILSGTPNILNVQAVPDIEKKAASIHVWLRYAGVPQSEKMHLVIREASTNRVAGEADLNVPAITDGNEQETVVKIPIRDCRLWSPEDPFLYQLDVQGSADSYVTRFGMRSFRLNPDTGLAELNGKPYILRGTNLTIYRFFEDPQRGDKPWREEWVRRFYKSFAAMHWNAARFSIGFPPEDWYRIADEAGILIQDEFPIWSGDTPNLHDADELAGEYREWMQDRWNHPSVMIWDGVNETADPQTGLAIRQVRGLDYSNRPWQNGWGTPVDSGDADEAHPYHFFFGPNQPFRMYKMPSEPGAKAGLLIAQPYAEQKLMRSNPVIINEYGGLWLNRDGSPTVLSKPIYDYLMEPSATTAERRRLYARDMAAITEFFRVHRKAFGVLEFTGLGYSRPGGQTSDDYIDVEKLTRDPDFSKYVGDAFAPVGLMVDSWAEEYPAGSTQEFSVLLVNDLNQEWKGDVRFRMLSEGKVVDEKTTPAFIATLGTANVAFTTAIPSRPAQYQVEATLLQTTAGAVSSVRDFGVLTPEQREAGRNLVSGQTATASSTRAGSRAEYAIDGQSSTNWTPANFKDTQWLSIDFGRSQSVSRLLLVWNWKAPGYYKAEVSNDGKTWDFAGDAKGSDVPFETIRFKATTARYLRLSIDKNDAGDYGLDELEAYH